MKLSVIIATYNWPHALAAVIKGYLQQTRLPDEILVADDGSDHTTRECVQAYQAKSPIPLVHLWHPDNGYQACAMRNHAARVACGDYLLYTDGDCVPARNLIEQHSHHARKNYFTFGNRILLQREFTERVLSQGIDLGKQSIRDWMILYHHKHCNRISPLLSLPLGLLRHQKKPCWKKVRSCHFALWKNDLLDVEGFDHTYAGIYEDSDLAVRLMRKGVRGTNLRFATTVFHLWHKENPRSSTHDNQARFEAMQASNRIHAEEGLSTLNNDTLQVMRHASDTCMPPVLSQPAR